VADETLAALAAKIRAREVSPVEVAEACLARIETLGPRLRAFIHVDADAVCPRCMRWIEPGDFVRRTAFGPHQHESCA
jgi:Asp-tRNA(Asn)/Glu-tRNA(Gln) amidotransferase A subunit family amidase